MSKEHRQSFVQRISKPFNILLTGLALGSCGGAQIAYPTARPGASEAKTEVLDGRNIALYSPFQGEPCTEDSPEKMKRLELYRQGYTEIVWKIGLCGFEPVYVKRISGEEYGVTPEGDRVLLAGEDEPPIVCHEDDAGLRAIQVYRNPQTKRIEIADSTCPPDSNGTILSPAEDETFVALTPEEQVFLEEDNRAKIKAQELVGSNFSSNEISAIAFIPAGTTAVQTLKVTSMDQAVVKIKELTAQGANVLGGLAIVGNATAVVAVMAGGSYAGVVRQDAEGDMILAIIDPISGKPVGLYGHNTITGVDTIISIVEDARVITDASGRTLLVNASALEGEATNINNGGDLGNPEIQPTVPVPDQSQQDDRQRNEIPKDSMEHLRWLKDTFSDEIPKEIIHGGYRHGVEYKVQKNWWTGVIADLDMLLVEGRIPSEYRQEVEAFIIEYTSEQYRAEYLYTATDIARANQLIDKVVGK